MSLKSATFSVHKDAPSDNAQAATARSASRPRGRLTVLYSRLAISASAKPKGIESAAGNRASWTSISSFSLGPRSHSNRTILLRDTGSGLSSNSRSLPEDLFDPVSASISTEVSRWIIPWTESGPANPSAVKVAVPGVRSRFRSPDDWECCNQLIEQGYPLLAFRLAQLAGVGFVVADCFAQDKALRLLTAASQYASVFLRSCHQA